MRLVVSVFLAVVLLLCIRHNVEPLSGAVGFDFQIFRTSSSNLLHGRPPYSEVINLDPPIVVAGFVPFAKLPEAVGFWIWTAIAVPFYFASLAVLVTAYPEKRRPLMALWVVALPGVWQALQLGQIYAPLIFCVTLAFVLVEQGRRGLLAGVLIGVLIAVKPNFVLWPLALLLIGDRKTASIAFGSAGVLSLFPLVISGPGIYRDYIDLARHVTPTGANGNSSLLALLARFGLPDVHIALAFAIALMVGVIIWKTRPRKAEASGIAILTALLASPIAWAGYVPFVLPVMFARRWHWPERIAAALMVVPLYLALDPAFAQTWGIAYTAALIILFAAVLWPYAFAFCIAP